MRRQVRAPLWFSLTLPLKLKNQTKPTKTSKAKARKKVDLQREVNANEVKLMKLMERVVDTRRQADTTEARKEVPKTQNTSEPLSPVAHIQSTCHLCGQHFQSPQDLTKHILSHSTQHGHVCNYCYLLFNTCYQLNKHISDCHTTGRFKCYICAANFHTKGGLMNHVAGHPKPDRTGITLAFFDPV